MKKEIANWDNYPVIESEGNLFAFIENIQQSLTPN
jgi:hypothetical protein